LRTVSTQSIFLFAGLRSYRLLELHYELTHLFGIRHCRRWPRKFPWVEASFYAPQLWLSLRRPPCCDASVSHGAWKT
jgi:hypothetical protein